MKTKSRPTGGSAQDRRRARRAVARLSEASAAGVRFTVDSPGEYFVSFGQDGTPVVAAASGSTSLPLSARDAAWDAGAADKRVRTWAGAEDGPNAKYAQAFFWKDSEGGDQFGDYKLGFADVVDGKLVAVFRGVTAAAAAVQGARGGVKLPEGDVAGVKSKIAAYYKKAATEYDDDGIKPPWAGAANESAAALLAYAELGPGVGTTDEEIGAEQAEFAAAAAAWEATGVQPSLQRAALASVAAAFQHGVGCECGHGVSEHLGGDGPCTHEDGRGTCSCSAFAEMQSGESAQNQLGHTARVTLGFDEAAVGELADVMLRHLRVDGGAAGAALVEAAASRLRAALEPALLAAAGDVAWGPEDGFCDLLCDLNELLSPGDMVMGGPRAIDVSVDLTRALVRDYDGDCYWIAPISVSSSDGEPTVAPPDEWIPVESGWVEVAPDEDGTMLAAATVRGAIRDLSLVSDAVVLPSEHQPNDAGGARADAPADVVVRDDELRWVGTLALEGVLTDDGRAIAPGALAWRELPLSLGVMFDTPHADAITSSPVCGRIDQIWREGSLIRASGVFDTSDLGRDVARMVDDRTLRGVSVDLAVELSEVGPRGDWFDDDGNWRDEPLSSADERSLVDILFGGTDEKPIVVFTKATIGATTICPFPAFADARIELASVTAAAAGSVWRATTPVDFVVAGGPDPEPAVPALTASAAGLAPTVPPADWFADPGLEALTPLTISDDGRIFGHAAAWDTCHLAFPDSCVTAPHSAADYSFFHLGEVVCDDGSRVSCGKITLDTGHAGRSLGRQDATAHYDDTGTGAADVRVGEDAFGIWVAGALRPDVDAEKARTLRAATLSGDWRNVDGNLELVALLAVNVPGFPVPRRPSALIASGEEGAEVLALVAAGLNPGPAEPAVLSEEEQARFAALLARVGTSPPGPAWQQFVELAARLNGAV